VTGQQPTPALSEDSYGVAPTSPENVNNGTLTQEISSPATYPASLAILQEMAISLQKQGSQGKHHEEQKESADRGECRCCLHPAKSAPGCLSRKTGKDNHCQGEENLQAVPAVSDYSGIKKPSWSLSARL